MWVHFWGENPLYFKICSRSSHEISLIVCWCLFSRSREKDLGVSRDGVSHEERERTAREEEGFQQSSQYSYSSFLTLSIGSVGLRRLSVGSRREREIVLLVLYLLRLYLSYLMHSAMIIIGSWKCFIVHIQLKINSVVGRCNFSSKYSIQHSVL